jgi:protein-S-isoprenylcysteine O-methyltransferase Ste14
MRATDFEFRYRFWIIAGLYFAGFACYWIDSVDAAQWLLRVLRLPAEGTPLHTVFGIGAALAGLSAFIRTWASAYLRSEVVHSSSLHSEALVADGPYRYVRNPLYLANFLLALAMGLIASRLGFLVLVGGHLIFFFRLIGREEEELLATQGESYRAYRDAVPAFWPALPPRVPAGTRRPQWEQAILSESFFWLLAIACGWFAATFNVRQFQGLTLAGLAFYVVMFRMMTKYT